MNPLFLSLVLLLLTITTTTTATSKIGVTFDPTTPNLPPLDSVITAIIHNNISTVRLINPTPYSIHAFSNTNITLLISVPNTFIHPFATNQSSSATWITHNILPFHNTTRISLITLSSTTHITRFHLPASRNLYTSLRKLGIVNIPVSVTFPLEKVLKITNWLTPSQSVFYEPGLIRPLVRFLKSTDSSFLVTVYPYNAYILSALLLQYKVDKLRGDGMTGVEYRNLFSVMVDSLVFALDGVGEGRVPVIVAETGWNDETIDVKSRLVDYLKKSGSKRVNEVYVYELFGGEWGIMDEGMRLKYDIDFSSGFVAAKKDAKLFKWNMKIVGLWVTLVLTFLQLLRKCLRAERLRAERLKLKRI